MRVVKKRQPEFNIGKPHQAFQRNRLGKKEVGGNDYFTFYALDFQFLQSFFQRSKSAAGHKSNVKSERSTGSQFIQQRVEHFLPGAAVVR